MDSALRLQTQAAKVARSSTRENFRQQRALRNNTELCKAMAGVGRWGVWSQGGRGLPEAPAEKVPHNSKGQSRKDIPGRRNREFRDLEVGRRGRAGAFDSLPMPGTVLSSR